MAKEEIIKEDESNFIYIKDTLYLKIPMSIQVDSNFPFNGEKKDKKNVTIKMLKDKLIVEKK